MASKIETGRIHESEGRTESPLDPREELKTFLPALPKTQANFLINLINLRDEEDNSLLFSDQAILDLQKVVDLDQGSSRRKREERLAAEQVKIKDVLSPFSPKERELIVRSIHTFQLTDGCSVACPECGVRAKRGIAKAFSYESIKNFFEKYGKMLYSGINLYHRSDPFDWISNDGKHDFLDLVEIATKNVKNARIFTTTAVPIGSELSIIKALMYFYSKSYDTGRKKGNREIFRVESLGEFRFSQTKRNKDRISLIFKTFKDMGALEGFMENMIDVLDRDGEKLSGTKGLKFKNIGHFINNPDRKEDGPDIFGLAGLDELTMSPAGILSESMEIVTSESPEGLRISQLIPGKLEIPENVWIGSYERLVDEKGNIFKLLPKFQYKTYDAKGNLTGIRTVESVRRDALAFCIAIDNLRGIEVIHSSEKVKKHPEWARDMKRELDENFVPQYRGRKASCQFLFENETDQQAIRIATKRMQEIDDWLLHMDEKLKISSSSKV